MLMKNSFTRKIILFLVKNFCKYTFSFIFNVFKFILSDNFSYFNISFDYFNDFVKSVIFLPLNSLFYGNILKDNYGEFYLNKTGAEMLRSDEDIYELLDNFMTRSDELRDQYPNEYSYIDGFCWLNVFHEDSHADLATKFPAMNNLFSILICMFDKNYKINDISFNIVQGHIRPYFYAEPFVFKLLRFILPISLTTYFSSKLYRLTGKVFKNRVFRFLLFIGIKMVLGSTVDFLLFGFSNLFLNLISRSSIVHNLSLGFGHRVGTFLINSLPHADRTFVSTCKFLFNNREKIFSFNSLSMIKDFLC